MVKKYSPLKMLLKNYTGPDINKINLRVRELEKKSDKAEKEKKKKGKVTSPISKIKVKRKERDRIMESIRRRSALLRQTQTQQGN